MYSKRPRTLILPLNSSMAELVPLTTSASPEHASAADLIDRLRTKRARIGVIGLGYVGLPLAVEFADAGFTVTPVDVDQSKVESIRRGESYIPDVPSERLREVVDAGRLSPTRDFAVLAEADAISICVPTPLRKTKDPDLSYIVAAVEEVSKYLRAGPADRARVHDVSGHHRRGRPADARARRAGGRARLLPRLLARAGRPGQRRVAHGQHAEGRRRRGSRLHRGGVRALRADRRAPSCRSRRPASPRW